jgi:energy-coupling factor transporter ATP-binding protein EcfA2
METTKADDRAGSRAVASSLPLAVDLRGLCKIFGAIQAVKGIDLDIESGEIVAFLGPNGAGKTSTIDMILGLSQPTADEVSGIRHASPPGHRARLGFRGDADRRPAQGPHRGGDHPVHGEPVRALTENVMQLLGFVLVIFAFGGGLFIPLSQYPHVLQTIATYTPLFGLNELTHAPLLGGSINISWVANVLAWLVIFAGGAIWRFRQDTARV